MKAQPAPNGPGPLAVPGEGEWGTECQQGQPTRRVSKAIDLDQPEDRTRVRPLRCCGHSSGVVVEAPPGSPVGPVRQGFWVMMRAKGQPAVASKRPMPRGPIERAIAEFAVNC